MTLQSMLLKREEKVIFQLRALFEQYGYKQFKMSKFEAYDFYAENRSFLNSENILTFSGLDGKLLALKPDVTLSIVKNTKASYDEPERVYYNENVYRTRKGTKEYREIMQVGLEYIGDVDAYATVEVLRLAQKSLQMISERFIMDLSHMGFLAGYLEELALSGTQREKLLACVGNKNGHGIRDICKEAKVSTEREEQLIQIAELYGPLEEALCQAKKLCVNTKMEQALTELEVLWKYLKLDGSDKGFYLDFSVVNGLDYYNGIIFQGFIDGVPSSILSGGRYDKLLHKLGKSADAIGFAVYLDLLERAEPAEKGYDTDILLLYEDTTDTAALLQSVQMLTDNGQSVTVQKKNTGAIRYKQLWAMKERGLEILGEDD